MMNDNDHDDDDDDDDNNNNDDDDDDGKMIISATNILFCYLISFIQWVLLFASLLKSQKFFLHKYTYDIEESSFC